MSAVPALRPLPDLEVYRRPSARPVEEPVFRPRVVTRKRQRVNVGALVASKAVLFGVVLGLTFTVSSLMGNVAIENVRQQARGIRDRYRAASMAVQPLENRLHELQAGNLTAGWATRNGFVAPVAIAHPSALGEGHEAQTQ